MHTSFLLNFISPFKKNDFWAEECHQGILCESAYSAANELCALSLKMGCRKPVKHVHLHVAYLPNTLFDSQMSIFNFQDILYLLRLRISAENTVIYCQTFTLIRNQFYIPLNFQFKLRLMFVL